MLERRSCPPSALFATEHLFFHWSLQLEQSHCWREEAVLHLPCLLQSIFPFIGPSMWNNLHAGEKRLSSIFLVYYRASFLSLVRPCGIISMLERRGCPPSSLFTTERLSFHWSVHVEQSPCWREEAVLSLPCLLQSVFLFIGPSVWNNLLAGEKRLLSVFLLHYSAASFFFSFFCLFFFFFFFVPLSGTITTFSV